MLKTCSLVAVSIALVCFASEIFAQQHASYEARLKELKIELPPASKPIASYVPAVRAGNLVFLAGAGPIRDGKATVTGKVGANVTEEQGRQAARQAVLSSTV
jgi:hypothetical protein